MFDATTLTQLKALSEFGIRGGLLNDIPPGHVRVCHVFGDCSTYSGTQSNMPHSVFNKSYEGMASIPDADGDQAYVCIENQTGLHVIPHDQVASILEGLK